MPPYDARSTGTAGAVADARADLADLLRGRMLRAVHGGALRVGDRLPSARELEAELGIDQRVVLDAYRILSAEGLVELRPRGGIYVASAGSPGEMPTPTAAWLSEIFAQGITREIPIIGLHEWLHRAVNTLRLRAVAVQETADQYEGLCRELQEDYGLEATGMDVTALETERDTRPELSYADLLVTTTGLEGRVRRVAERLGKPLIAVEMKPDPIPGEWRLLLLRPLYVLVGDERFVEVLLDFFSSTPGSENLRPLVVGRDDLSVIPVDAPVYVTRSARHLLDGVEVRGRVLPSARLFSAASSLSLIGFIVESNLAALEALRSRPLPVG